jgi:hypothetical protein
MLEAGRTYVFPFIFVVPQYLLPHVCKHEIKHETIRDCHLQLPPSLGNVSPHDDLSPDMAKIQYQIAACITLASDISNTSKNTVTRMKTVRIVPNVSEQPPVHILGNTDYTLRSEKSIKKGLFKGELGTLVIEAEQPRSLRLPKSYDPEGSVVSTVATVKLRFDPADKKSHPPRLGSLRRKLKSTTFYTTSARIDLPKKKDVIFDHKQGSYSVDVGLSSCCMGSVAWTPQRERTPEVEQLARRESSLSHQGIPKYPSPSTNYKGQNFWTAEIVVQVALPKNKQFVPTFHGCLISRVYSLNLSLGIHSARVGLAYVELELPLQISSGGKGEVDVTSQNSSLVEAQWVGSEFYDELLAAEHGRD